MEKPRLSVWQIANISVGVLGIQFGWGLQNANMSAIFEKLGATPSLLPLLWLAGPMTSLLAHPIVGFMSDRTWTRIGRRRPFLIGGAICAFIALFFMPTSPTLWVAASILWIQDFAINATSEPFRPLIADKLGEGQRTLGFAVQSFFNNLGAAFASVMPFILSIIGVTGETSTGIPLTIKYAFRFGAVFFLASVLWTVLSTKETPPENLAALRERQKATRGRAWFKEFFGLMGKMPQTMRQFAVVQIFTSLGMFSIYIFLSPTIARHVFGATGPQSPSYNQGIEWAGVCFGVSSVISLVAALLLPRLATLTSRKMAHALTLICGGLGLLSIYLIQNPYLVLISIAGVGLAGASVPAMPYAILSSAISRDQMGVYMGMFSFFIAGPGIFAMLAFRPLMKYFFNSNPLYIVMCGGCCFLIAAALMWRVRDPVEQKELKPATKSLEQDALLMPERLT